MQDSESPFSENITSMLTGHEKNWPGTHAPPKRRISKLNIGDLLSDKISRDVEQLIDRSERRQNGIFFSGRQWAEKLTKYINFSEWNRIIDPACGTGDLLAACINTMHLTTTLTHQPNNEMEFIGYEIRADLAEISEQRLNLIINSLDQKKNNQFRATASHQNSLWRKLKLQSHDCIIMNPPYHSVSATRSTRIGKGRISAAALFVEKVIRELPPGGGLIALIPESLRSGSRYKKLRDLIDSQLAVESFCAAGHFGETADIDVAILVGRKRSQNTEPVQPEVESTNKPRLIRNIFDVRVGSVVPHRTKKDGESLPYLDASSIPTWKCISKIEKKASYNSTSIAGPLLVIRRTSSPTDKKRARATIISSRDRILIENHLIICKPISGGLKACAQLMRSLEDPRTDQWLNQRIRCRHLTTEAIKELPIWG